jgi:hypothetical protein
MKDNEIRGIVLQKFYDDRRNQAVRQSISDFIQTADFDQNDLFRACEQLAEHGLIKWSSPIRTKGETDIGHVKITARGVDVVEGNIGSPIAITFDQSVSVHSSSNVQIGSHNVQDISIQIGKLVSAIDHSTASDEQKAEAKSLLRKFLEHPLVASIAGGLASTIKW